MKRLPYSAVSKAVLLIAARTVPTSWHGNCVDEVALELLLSRIPDDEEFRFEHRKSLWYAEREGVVRFFSWAGPENNGGFSGSHIPIRLVNGRKVILKGPWSASAGAMNRAGFGPCVDVHMTDDQSAFERGYTMIAGAVTLAMAEVACRVVGGIQMKLKVDTPMDLTYRPERIL